MPDILPSTPLSRLAGLLLLLTCCTGAAAQAQAPQPLLLTFGAGNSGVISSSTRQDTRMRGVDGAQVVLQRASGSDYKVVAGQRNWTWFQVEEVPATESYIAVTPRLQGDQVTLEVAYTHKDGNDRRALSTTASGPLGSWIVLLDDSPAPGSGGGKRYSSSAGSERLAVKVEKLP
tara:strand:- start:2327 stop:2851 length:525 start_codon:yes stop_codon:yes gene_type:complete